MSKVLFTPGRQADNVVQSSSENDKVRGGAVGEGGWVAMNGPATHLARYDPALGRVPTRVAQALFSGEDWVTTEDLAITTALEADRKSVV